MANIFETARERHASKAQEGAVQTLIMASYPFAFVEYSLPSSAPTRNGDVVVLEYWGQSGFANTAQYRLGLPTSRPISSFTSAS